MTRPTARPSGFFVLRTPLLPFSDLVEWGSELEGRAHLHDGALAGALARDLALLRRRLEETVTGPVFRDALFVASPSLEAAIDTWRKEPDSDRGRTAEHALVSYFSRAAARPTPFGLFAGCSTGRTGERTTLRLDGRARYRRSTRVDMDYLWSLASAVERHSDLRRELVFHPNSSLYEVGDRLLFAEAREGERGRSYRLVAVEKTPYLLETVARARGGARLADLAAALVDDEITQAEAEEYVGDLVDAQVLVADVRPLVTGPPATEGLITALAGTPATERLAGTLTAVAGDLARIDQEGLGAPPQRYRAAAARLEELPAAPELSRFVQVDMLKPADGLELGRDVLAALLHGVDVLHVFSRGRPDGGLRLFRERFVQRYETREVPLAEVLDEENGIGFERSSSPSAEAAPLLAGLPLERPEEPSERWTERDGVLLGLVASAAAAHSREITLDPALVERLRRDDAPALPDAFEVLAEVTGPSPGDGQTGEHRVVVHSASGPSGARLAGRFCSVDPRLSDLVRRHLRDEEAARPDRVFAEVVHLPEGRVGNILSRPVLRSHEIPYLGRSGAPPDRQLELSDLLLSVRDGRIVLRSRRLGREVAPRLTTAHQHSRGLGVYRFLCALQHQDVAGGLFWDWGPLGTAPFLPRVVSGRVVLSRARWNLDDGDLGAFREATVVRRFAAVQSLRERRGLPRYAALADADNELVADLDNVLSVESVAHRLRRRTTAAFVEVTDPDRLAASGPDGPFTSQILVPFVRSAPAPEPRRSPAQTAGPTAPRVRRRFPPGSEWLYVKLYAGPATADRVLDRAAAVVDAALSSGAADRWFFLRFGDPDPHLRLRLHGRADELLGHTVPSLHRAVAPLLETGELWRVQLDTYEREVERYGGDRAIELAERIFAADSEAVLAVVRGLRGDAGAALRWRAALLGMDLLFDDLGLPLDTRRAVARRARDGYGREFGVDGTFRRAVSHRYREQRPAVDRLLDPSQDPPAELAAPAEALRRRSMLVAPLGRALRGLAERGGLTVTLPELALSLAHMHVNRMLRSAHRAQELVLYELLDRSYSSRAARGKE